MKRIFQIASVLFFIYFLILLFWDYSNLLEKTLNTNTTKVELSKDLNLTNSDYIDLIKRICNETDSSLYYRTYSDNTLTYYIVDENNNYFDFDLHSLFKKNTCLSTKANASQQINFISIGNIYKLRSLDKIENYKLDTALFYLNTKNYTAFENKCKESNIIIRKIENCMPKYGTINFNNMMIPIALMTLVFIMYSLSTKRNVLIRRLSGFSDIDNFIYSLKQESMLIGLPCLFFFIIFLATLTIIYKTRTLGFISYSLPYLIKLLILVLIVFILQKIILSSGFDISLLKGKREKKYIFALICFMEFVLSILSCTNINTNYGHINNLYNVYKNYKNSYDTLDKYVSCTINTSNTCIDDDNQLDYNEKFENFYQDTVNKYDGLLIETRNYRSIYGSASNYELDNYNCNICVNENYINKENIYDTKGNKISSDSLDANKYNILIPSNLTKKQYLNKFYCDEYDEDELNIITYQENTRFNSYQAYSCYTQEIINPIVEIYNIKYKKNQMLNYISGGYYILKIDGKNPYDKLIEDLDKYDLDKVVLEAPYVKNSFSEYMSVLITDIVDYTVSLLVYIFGWIATIIFATKEFEAIYGKTIFIKLTSGFSKLEVYKLFLLVQFFIMILTILWILYRKLEAFLVIGLIIIFLYSVFMLLKNNKVKELERIWEL